MKDLTQKEVWKMARAKKPSSVRMIIEDETRPLKERRDALMYVCQLDTPEASEELKAILNAAASGDKDAQAETARKYKAMMAEFEGGPKRCGTVSDLEPSDGKTIPAAHVRFPDGGENLPIVPDEQLFNQLRVGDSVIVDHQAIVVLSRHDRTGELGEVASYERRLGPHRVEVSFPGDKDIGHVYTASADLIDQLDDGLVKPGCRVIVDPRQQFAFAALPKNDTSEEHFKFLSEDEVPDIRVDRDIGDPPEFIDEIDELVREEILDPESRREYRLRRSQMMLLTGISGSGKTLCIEGSIRRIYEVVSDITGVPVDSLPRRVLRLKASNLLSQWLGVADKNADRFMDEVSAVAKQKITGADGKEYDAPVIVIIEEIDAIARRRSAEEINTAHDRILTTILQRFDTTREGVLKHGFVIAFFTTNVPHLVDEAFMRRAGGEVYLFGRLKSRRSFAAVLEKHIRGVPLASHNGQSTHQLGRDLVNETTAHVYGGEAAQTSMVEVRLAGNSTPIVKQLSDFLTGSVVDLAIQRAAKQAYREKKAGSTNPGLTSTHVIKEIYKGVETICDQLTTTNVGSYVDLPDGAHPSDVRRIERTSLRSFQLERT